MMGLDDAQYHKGWMTGYRAGRKGQDTLGISFVDTPYSLGLEAGTAKGLEMYKAAKNEQV